MGVPCGRGDGAPGRCFPHGGREEGRDSGLRGRSSGADCGGGDLELLMG